MSEILNSKFNKKTRAFENIFPLICSKENLEQAWYEIKNKQSNLTSGGYSSYTLEIQWFENVFKKLKSGSYKYLPVRQVFIPKPNKIGKRIFHIGSFRDKVI